MIDYSVEGGTKEKELVERAFCFAIQELMLGKET